VTRLILWRHGQTAWNAAHRVQGQTDIDLSEIGRAQAAAAASFLATLQPDAIVSSDLRRAADTAAQLATLTGLDVALDPQLRERGYGEWEGCTDADLQPRWPEAYARWRRGEPVQAAGVEENEEVAKRVLVALQEAAERAPGGTTVVVCHGGAARLGTGALLGWPAPVVRNFGGLANCHWTDLRLTPMRGWMLEAHNVGALVGTVPPPAASE